VDEIIFNSKSARDRLIFWTAGTLRSANRGSA
jgi:hypothetical protein